MERLKLVTAPTAEPVTLTEAKEHLRVEQDAENDLILRQLRACREFAEKYTGRQLMTATFDLFLDDWPALSGLRRTEAGGYVGGDLLLPRPPLQSVTSVKYYDADGTEQTWDSANYLVEANDDEPGRVVRAYGVSWPSIQDRPSAITVRFIAGYSAASAVPQAMKEAILLLLGSRHAQREATVAPIGGQYAELPVGFKELLDAYRVWEVR